MTRVEETGSLSRPSLNSRSPVHVEPGLGPHVLQHGDAAAADSWPKWKSWPTTTARVSRQPISTSRTKSSAGSTAPVPDRSGRRRT